jgi:hypothetical protein
MKTSFQLATLGAALALVAGMAATTLAGPPYDAGFKARGMKTLDRGNAVRVYAAPTWTAPAAGRQAFSYEPQAAAMANQPNGCVNQGMAAQAPRADGGTRRFSYEPAAPAPVYRGWTNRAGRGHTGYGGDYPSKANLKY